MHSINFTVTRKKFCLSLHYNWANNYLLVNGTEIYKFKAKDSEIVATSLCLGIISKDWSTDNMKRKGFNGYVYDFTVDYDATDVDDIKGIHKYFMKKKKHSVNENIWICEKSAFRRISDFIRFHNCKFFELYFNEQSRV